MEESNSRKYGFKHIAKKYSWMTAGWIDELIKHESDEDVKNYVTWILTDLTAPDNSRLESSTDSFDCLEDYSFNRLLADNIRFEDDAVYHWLITSKDFFAKNEAFELCYNIQKAIDIIKKMSSPQEPEELDDNIIFPLSQSKEISSSDNTINGQIVVDYFLKSDGDKLLRLIGISKSSFRSAIQTLIDTRCCELRDYYNDLPIKFEFVTNEEGNESIMISYIATLIYYYREYKDFKSVSESLAHSIKEALLHSVNEAEENECTYGIDNKLCYSLEIDKKSLSKYGIEITDYNITANDNEGHGYHFDIEMCLQCGLIDGQSKLTDSIKLVSVFYDKDGELVTSQELFSISCYSFDGFKVQKSIIHNVPAYHIGRILIYAEKY